MASVVLDHLWKEFTRGRAAVNDLSLTVAHGEFVVLVGPSGCGKSTTLRMVAGLESATRGTISIDGRVVNDLPPKDRDVAMVFQNYALYPHMTVEKNLAFPLKMRGLPRGEVRERVAAVARTLGLDDLLRRRPAELSGGQRQRVAVGRAIVRQPKVFLFDEPLSNLDAKLRAEMRAEIKRLHRSLGATMIYVTHDQVEAMTLGDRIVIMDDGVIQQAAPPLETYHQPRNRFVAGFIGSAPMNFLRASPEEAGAVARLLDCDSAAVALGAALGAAAARHGREMILGVRPEALAVSRRERDAARPAADADGAAAGLAAVVDVVEPLGDGALVSCQAGAQRILARQSGDPTCRAGDAVFIRFPPDRLFLFDPASGERIA